MNKLTILICDDNVAVHESLTLFLQEAGMQTISIYEGTHIIDILKKRKIDLVVLDIMLPGKPGTDICEEIRSVSDIPIIMLSARDEEEDRILGLKLGADDYVTKPFSPMELVMRINTIMNRLKPRTKNLSVFFSNLILHPDSYSAYVNETPLELTPKEFAVLQYLAEKPDKVLSRDLILDEVWGFSYLGDGRSVDTIVRRIRMKLEKAGANCSIQSVYGVGYVLKENGVHKTE